MTDWKAEAERLKFDVCLSWSEIYEVMKPYFPDLTDKQIEEKIRGTLRRSKRYHAATAHAGNNTHFTYYSDGEVHIYIISDVHCGAHGFQKKGFQKYIAQIAADDKAVVLCLGDMIDNATQGSKGCVYSQRVVPQKQIELIIEMLTPIKDKIIFFCDGNHEERTFRQTGSDPGYTMCLGLQCLDKYNYVHGYITITACGKAYKFYATHNIGRAENKLRTTARAHADSDFVIGGHIHAPRVLLVASQLHSGKLRNAYAITGKAWLKDESYSISAAYEPVSDKQPFIILNGQDPQIIQ